MKKNIFAVVGRSGSGKTTLIIKLIRYFKSKGQSVSIIKSTHHDFEFDYPGKDTHSLKIAGAKSVIAFNDKKLGLITDVDKELNAVDVAEKYFKDSDVVIIEGNKKYSVIKIEVIGNSVENPLFSSGIENIKMIVTDKKIDTHLPVFIRDDVDGIARWIEENFLKG
jgi:molybdopterin-guanine dinucleotide biosynthesis protein B